MGRRVRDVGIVPSMSVSDVSKRAAPPERYILLYDGRCPFCEIQAGRLVRLARRGALDAVSFHERGVLERFPGLSIEDCSRAMHLIDPDGKVFVGCEAAVQALKTRGWLGLPALVYYLPGLRQVLNGAYRWIAANRRSVVR